MIKFFRKIRQRLVTDSKFGRYLLYALGEIILVVIGILIALGINNWNQNRLQANEEIKLLTSLSDELELNIQKFDDTHSLHVARIESINEVLFTDLSNHTIQQLDSLFKLTFYSWTYNPSFSLYNSIVTSGKINIITNDSIIIGLSNYRDLLTDYLEDEFHAFNYTSDNIFKYQTNQSKTLIETRFNLRSRTDEEATNDVRHYLAEFKNPVVRNQFSLLLLHIELIIGEGEILRRELLDLKDLIDNNIDVD